MTRTSWFAVGLALALTALAVGGCGEDRNPADSRGSPAGRASEPAEAAASSSATARAVVLHVDGMKKSGGGPT